MTPIFKLGFYDMMDGDFLRIVEDFRESRKALGFLNSTFIALIPKGQDLFFSRIYAYFFM
jgi:hypothetical protein